ncbi:MAG: GNAT family N-acetyltransferase [Bacillota bacterium]|nr:GNAT family N-acetyltransferase [Bacillota bacterium]
MNYNVSYQKIYPNDYEILTKIMTDAFNEDTTIHTNLEEDGPTGYNNGRLMKWLNENEGFESYKIVYDDKTVWAFTVDSKQNNEYSLEMLFINPDYREYHLGTIVWKDIEQKYIDAKKWTVETPDYSKRNHHFYIKKCGFSFYREKMYENGSKSYVLVKEK